MVPQHRAKWVAAWEARAGHSHPHVKAGRVFTVSVRFRFDPAARAASLAAMRDVASLMRHEPGCVRFEVLEPLDDSDSLLFHEVWTDRAAWEAHLANRPSAIAALARTIGSGFAAPPEVMLFTVVS